MKYPLGRFSPHGKSGKSVYQRAAQEAKESYNAGGISLIDAIVTLIIIGAVGLGIYAMFTGGGEAVGVLLSFSKHKWYLNLSGLKSIDEELAKALIKHQGRLQVDGEACSEEAKAFFEENEHVIAW